MTAIAQELLTAFDALPDAEGGDLPAEAFEELADELFRSYDLAEDDDAAR